MATMGLAEIIDKAGKKKTKAEKVAVLKEHSSPALKDLFTYMCDPQIEFLVPTSRPPFKKMDKSSDLQGAFIQEVTRKKINYFIGYNENAWGKEPQAVHNIAQVKREDLFIRLLETIDPDDAELLLLVVKKELPKGISLPVVKEYIPKRAENW